MSSSAKETRGRWSLEGKTALVTGGTKGIGKAVVEELASLGASVLTCSRHTADVTACIEELAIPRGPLHVAAIGPTQGVDSPSEDRACEEWQGKGYKVRGTTADVTTTEGRESLANMAYAQFGGRLDILVNNVGTNIRKATVEYTQGDFFKIMDTNLTSFFMLTQLAHPLLKAAAAAKGAKENGGASVVNISSIGGLTAIKSGSPYAASKSAMNQLTKNLGCEWAPDGIRVNAVAPWYTKTPLAEPVLANPAKVAEINQRTPMGRWAEADEVSALVAFLCMRGAGYITSQVIAVDGGFMANGWMT